MSNALNLASVFDQDSLLNTFLQMVRINSPSGAEEPLRQYLLSRLHSICQVYPDVSVIEDAKGNLIVDIPAQDCLHQDILVFSGHMDVVPPCLDIEPLLETLPNGDTIIRSSRTTVLGADDKAALAPMLEAVIYSLTYQTARPHLRLLLTVEEETGLYGAKAIEPHYLDTAGFSVIFDHTGDPGLIIHQAPSYVRYTISFSGKSVHAGIMPEQGVNAIVFAARVLRRMPQGRLDVKTTANIGKISGGKGTNVVPDQVEVSGEIRGDDDTVIESTLAAIQAILHEEQAAMEGTGYTFKTERTFTQYSIDPEHIGIQRVKQAMRNVDVTPKLTRTSGGSDNHIFVERGLPGVVLSACYVEPHSLDERVALSDMLGTARLMLSLMNCFAQEPFKS